MNEEDHGDALDPRVQVELESLNVCTEEINRLEIQLDEANAQFRNALSESTQRLKYLSSRLGKCIDKSRPYYEAVDQAKKGQVECQKAAIQFQRAASLHATAKETIFLAEQKFKSKQDEWQFDTAWQEMLNHATAKVMEADVQRAESEKEHQKRAILFAKAEHHVQQLEQKLKSAITKSKPYFETKDIFQNELQLLKERVQNLQKAVVQAKERYAQALRNLEAISEQIHEKRKLRAPREPGVGAEELDLATLRLEEPRHLPDTIQEEEEEDRVTLKRLNMDSAPNSVVVSEASSSGSSGQGDCRFEAGKLDPSATFHLPWPQSDVNDAVSDKVVGWHHRSSELVTGKSIVDVTLPDQQSEDSFEDVSIS